MPKAKALLPIVVAEYQRLPTPSQTTRMSYYQMYRTDKAMVSAEYHTALNYSMWRKSYIHALTSHGWTLTEEKVVYNWGADCGIRLLTFSKRQYYAQLEWDGGRKYSINIERQSPLY